MLNKMYDKKNTQSVIRKVFMHGLKRKAEIGKENVYDFSLGNPSIPAPITVKTSIEKLIQENPVTLHAYSPNNGFPEVRKSIANYIKTNTNFPANPDHVFVTSGAAGAVTSCIHAVSDINDEIIVISPFFTEYDAWIKTARCKIIKVPAEKDTFQLDVKAIEKAITPKTSAIIINSPNNPTGAIYPAGKIQELADMLINKQAELGHDIYLIVDEPYRLIAYDIEVPYVPAFYPNTLVCDSASKSLSLPGERIGYVYVSDTAPKVDQIYDAVAGAARGLGHVCASVLFQRMYEKCINEPLDVSEYKKNRQLLTQILDKVGLAYVEPEGAYYLWVKSPFEDEEKFCEIAKKYELLFVPSSGFGTKGWVRLGYCIPTQTIINSKSAFKKLMKEIESSNK